MRQRMSSSVAQVHEVPMRSRIDFGVAARVAAIAKATGCRLVHSHTVRSALVARRIQRAVGLPWLHQVHSPALHESTHVLMNVANYLAEASVMRRADRVVTVSQALAGYVTRRATASAGPDHGHPQRGGRCGGGGGERRDRPANPAASPSC